jgi:hypothetical protein
MPASKNAGKQTISITKIQEVLDLCRLRYTIHYSHLFQASPQKDEIATAMTCASLWLILTVVDLTPALSAAALASP